MMPPTTSAIEDLCRICMSPKGGDCVNVFVRTLHDSLDAGCGRASGGGIGIDELATLLSEVLQHIAAGNDEVKV